MNVISEWESFHDPESVLKYLDEIKDILVTDVDNQPPIQDLPFRFSAELSHFPKFQVEYQFAPGLHAYLPAEAIENPTLESDKYAVRLFHGDRQEIYYVLCDNEERITSPVYCQFPNEEPTVYAECVTSLIITIAQCYQSGAYYIAVNQETGEKTIEQDLDKIEPIFEKFNPDQIDN